MQPAAMQLIGRVNQLCNRRNDGPLLIHVHWLALHRNCRWHYFKDCGAVRVDFEHLVQPARDHGRCSLSALVGCFGKKNLRCLTSKYWNPRQPTNQYWHPGARLAVELMAARKYWVGT